MSSNHVCQTVIGEDTEVRVLFEYTPPEPGIMSGPCMQPAEPARLTLNAVILDGDDLQDELGPQCLDRIEQFCWRHVETCELGVDI